MGLRTMLPNYIPALDLSLCLSVFQNMELILQPPPSTFRLKVTNLALFGMFTFLYDRTGQKVLVVDGV